MLLLMGLVLVISSCSLHRLQLIIPYSGTPGWIGMSLVSDHGLEESYKEDFTEKYTQKLWMDRVAFTEFHEKRRLKAPEIVAKWEAYAKDLPEDHLEKDPNTNEVIEMKVTVGRFENEGKRTADKELFQSGLRQKKMKVDMTMMTMPPLMMIMMMLTVAVMMMSG
eukprot:9125479-Karenia_brevis.AAC.1